MRFVLHNFLRAKCGLNYKLFDAVNFNTISSHFTRKNKIKQFSFIAQSGNVIVFSKGTANDVSGFLTLNKLSKYRFFGRNLSCCTFRARHTSYTRIFLKYCSFFLEMCGIGTRCILCTSLS